MIAVSEASERILARISPLAAETVATENLAGRVLAEEVVAPITSPRRDNSSMDGYAVRSEDVGAGESVELEVVESIAAGTSPSRGLERGEAMRVMTGAPVPNGADSVIRREDTDDGREKVVIRNFRDVRKNIRKAGEDFRMGDVLFPKGEALRVPHIGALASAGIRSAMVHRRPSVSIITSGDELVELSDFHSQSGGERIVSSNSVTLPALIRDAGGEPRDLGIAKDDPASLHEKLHAARDSDLIVTSAGISVGDHDYVRPVFRQMGGTIDFWKVRMRPGAPLAFGMLGSTPWIGLSGNPVSAMITFEIFVRPVIRKMLGHKSLFPRTVPVRLGQPITLAAPLMHFLRATVKIDESGEAVAVLAGSQSSSVITAMARADALLILSGDRLELAAGESHRALPLGETLSLTDRLMLS